MLKIEYCGFDGGGNEILEKYAVRGWVEKKGYFDFLYKGRHAVIGVWLEVLRFCRDFFGWEGGTIIECKCKGLKRFCWVFERGEIENAAGRLII